MKEFKITVKLNRLQKYVFLLTILMLNSAFFSVARAGSSKEALNKTIEIIKTEGEDKLAELQARKNEAKQREATAKLLQENAKRKLSLLDMQEAEFKKKFNSFKRQKEEVLQEQAKAHSEEVEAKQTQLNLQQMQQSVKKKAALLENEIKAVLRKIEDMNKVVKNPKLPKEAKKAENNGSGVNAKKHSSSTQTADETLELLPKKVEASPGDVAIPVPPADVSPAPAPIETPPAPVPVEPAGSPAAK